MKVSDLFREVESRKERKDEIRSRANKFCLEMFGISDFFSLVDKMFAKQEKFAVCLSRQVSTVNVEHVGLKLFTEWLTSLSFFSEALPISFTKDAFSGENSFKKSLIKIPYIGRSRNGNIFCHCESIVDVEQKRNLDGRILESLRTQSGQLLTDFHHDLRKTVFNEDSKTVDASDFFLTCLCQNLKSEKKKPSMVCIDCDGIEKRLPSANLNGHLLSRPTADWYYFFNLLAYTDGSRCMVSTIDDNHVVSRWFNSSLEKIEAAVGIKPLIVDIPCRIETASFVSDLNHVNRRLINPRWRDKIVFPSNDADLFGAFEHLERQVIELH
jgi:hypothetical protein